MSLLDSLIPVQERQTLIKDSTFEGLQAVLCRRDNINQNLWFHSELILRITKITGQR